MKYSFIVPVFNGASYIKMCLTSILNQTYKNFEIIVVDDGSTDNSGIIATEILANTSQKQIITQTNQGLSVARNVGMCHVTGDYICFVDADDTITPNYLQTLHHYLQKKPVDMLKFNLTYLTTQGQTPQESDYSSNILKGETALTQLIQAKKVFEPAVLYAYSKKFLDTIQFQFEPERFHEDFGSIPITLLKANTVLLINDCLYNYRQVDESITRTTEYAKINKRAYDILFFYDKIILDLEQITIDIQNTKIFLSFLANAVISQVSKLANRDKKAYKQEIKKRRIVEHLLTETPQQKIKKIIYKITF